MLVIDTAPYAIAEITLGRLSLVPGLRFEPVLIEGSPSLPAGGTTPPSGYASFSLPENPVDELPSDRYRGGAALPARTRASPPRSAPPGS